MQNQNTQDRDAQEVPEQRIWRAVIASAVEEWVRGPLTKQRAAEQYLLHDDKDFRTVCYSAGINPDDLRARLQKIKARQSKGLLDAATRN
jgi:hypothetical protein